MCRLSSCPRVPGSEEVPQTEGEGPTPGRGGGEADAHGGGAGGCVGLLPVSSGRRRHETTS